MSHGIMAKKDVYDHMNNSIIDTVVMYSEYFLHVGYTGAVNGSV